MYEITLVYKLTLNSTVCVKVISKKQPMWFIFGCHQVKETKNQRGARKNAKDH